MLSVKKAIVHYVLNRKARQANHAQQKGPLKLLFLFAVRDKAELDYYQHIVKLIEKYNTYYDVLVFCTDEMLRRIPVHYANHRIIIAKDIGLLELPKKEMEARLKAQEYKGVVNTFSGYLPVLDFAAATVPSKARITRNKESNLHAYNMRIDINDENDSNFIEHTIEYLNKIK